MNESIFLLHVAVVIAFALGALKLGKEALTTWVALQAVLANLFVIKQMHFFGFTVTCSDVFAIGSIAGLNLLQEYFGKEIAKRAALICFCSMLFFGVMGQIHLLYLPSPEDVTQAAFTLLLSPTPRLLIASIATFFIVQQIDLRFYGLLKKYSVPARGALALCVSQLLDTSLFSLLGLYGIVASLSDIILVSFLVKLAIIGCMTPLTALSKKIVHHEI